MPEINSDYLQTLGLKTKPPAKANDKLDQTAFLKLMTTQIQNQDPFKPMENGDFLAQMAQFGTVSGISDLQKSFDGFSNSLVSNQALQASSLVGRNIVVKSDSFNISPGQSMSGQVDLTSSAQSVTVDITKGGQVIKTINLGPQSSGKIDFSWDGKLDNGTVVPAGQYKMTAKAKIGANTVAMQTLAAEKVDSVSLGSGKQGLVLNTISKNSYSFNQITQVK